MANVISARIYSLPYPSPMVDLDKLFLDIGCSLYSHCAQFDGYGILARRTGSQASCGLSSAPAPMESKNTLSCVGDKEELFWDR